MEEEIGSMISNGETSVIEDISDSNSTTYPSPASKRFRHGSNICTSKFKGVVPQQNGHWGCQIYANHQRIWLGTFKSEKEAAMAYDSAAIKLRSGDSHRNFPLTNITAEEPNFQSYYSTEAVLGMIKDGTYQSKFADFIRTRSQNVETEISLTLLKAHNNRGLTCKQLFQKELTPSDVGKLNRLVIPKKYAIKFFPNLSEGIEENEAVDKVEDEQLDFYDRSMKKWTFRYCYWRSSQSFVFTRGWNWFVKEKKLKANDNIAFCLCECIEDAKAVQTFYMIDVINGENNSNMVQVSNQSGAMEVNLQLQLGKRAACDDIGEEGLVVAKPMLESEKRGFKLFGVQIV